MRRGASERGRSLIELIVATALLAGVALASSAVVVYGFDAYKQTVGAESAIQQATRALAAIGHELKDAPASTLLVSEAEPDRISFRRIIGYDPLGATDEARRILTPVITLRRVLQSGAGASALYAIERSEQGRTTSRLVGGIAAADPMAPTLPGLRFTVTRTGATTLVDIVVAVTASTGKGGTVTARRATTVSLEIQ